MLQLFAFTLGLESGLALEPCVKLPALRMTYSLNALNASSGKAPPKAGIVRFGHEVCLVIALLALVFWLLALFTYSPQDAAWSTSGLANGVVVRNWAGRFGAWLADTSFFGFGYSVWWAVLAAICAWGRSLRRWMRGETLEGRGWRDNLNFWLGLALLLAASTALEWSRLYRLESSLPGHAGGVLGYLLGKAGVGWFGFTGSGLLGIMLLILGAGLVFHFSWGGVAETLGARIDTLVRLGQQHREKVKDVAVGKKAVKERREVFEDLPQSGEEVLQPRPVQIKTPAAPPARQAAPRWPCLQGLVGLDVGAQGAQRSEDAAVFLVVRTQLEAIALADGQRQLQRVNRVQAKAVIEQRGLWVDLRSVHLFQVEAFHQQLGQFELGWGLLRHGYIHLFTEAQQSGIGPRCATVAVHTATL